MKRLVITIADRGGKHSRLTYTDHGWMVYKGGKTVSFDARGPDAALEAEAAGIIPPGTLPYLALMIYYAEQLFEGRADDGET